MPNFRYHVTPRRNLKSIREEGICPWYSTGKLQASWYVKANKLMWAIRHVAARHGVEIDDVAVIRVDLPLTDFVNRGQGRYTLAYPAYPKDFVEVADYNCLIDREFWQEEGLGLRQE